jgi:outer membrane protein TolC
VFVRSFLQGATDRRRAVLVAVLATGSGAPVIAADLPPPPAVSEGRLVTPDPLPQPLDMGDVLSLPLDSQYGVLAARARYERNLAERVLTQSDNRPEVTLGGRLRYIEPGDLATENDQHDDHRAGLSIRQKLFDFGRQQDREAAAKARVEGARLALLGERKRQRLALLRAYFDVLLADQRYQALNERMAILFTRYDRARDRHELGQTSDYELARFENDYQQVLLDRARADADRRMSRRRLAEIAGRPDQLPRQIEPPDLDGLFEREIPEVGELIETALTEDLQLKALRQRYAGSESDLEAARSSNWPEVYAEIDADHYTRESSTRDPFRAGVYLEFPLWRGGARNGEIRAAQAERMAVVSEMAEREAAIRRYATELVETIRLERTAGQSRIEALDKFAELNFVHNQTLYQMEKATDLGDAMAQMSQARLERMTLTFDLATRWAEYALLTNQPLETVLSGQPDTPSGGDNATEETS